jgi:hypothetical protein
MKFFLVCLLSFICAVAQARPSDQLVHALKADFSSLKEVPADSEKAMLLQSEFAQLLQAMQLRTPIKLMVVREVEVAKAYPGRVIAVHEDVGTLSQSQRVFVLTHELAHVLQDHFTAYYSFLDAQSHTEQDEFTGEEAAVLRGFQTVSHNAEFSADDFAKKVVLALGLSIDDAIGLLRSYRDAEASLTHPAPAARVARLVSANSAAK